MWSFTVTGEKEKEEIEAQKKGTSVTSEEKALQKFPTLTSCLKENANFISANDLKVLSRKL